MGQFGGSEIGRSYRVTSNLYILRSLYANEAEGLKYNGKQWKFFGHKLVLGKLGDWPETFHLCCPLCLDGGRLGRFFSNFFRRENRLLLRTFFHCLLSGGRIQLGIFCFSMQFCHVQIPLF